jgi:hypothetical protein
MIGSNFSVEDMWRKNTQEVAEEYAQPDRFGFGHGSYFYDNYYGPNYYVHEQQRLKNIVEEKKEFGHPNFNKNHLKNLIMQSVMNRMEEGTKSQAPKVSHNDSNC